MNAVVETLLPISLVVNMNEVNRTTQKPNKNIAPSNPPINTVFIPWTKLSKPVSFPATIPVKLYGI